jgi:nucleoid DNA-binding protein
VDIRLLSFLNHGWHCDPETSTYVHIFQSKVRFTRLNLKSRLSSGEDVLISGFGKFCVKEKRERRGRNPVTGEDMMLAPRRVVTFKCSRQLRDEINL